MKQRVTISQVPRPTWWASRGTRLHDNATKKASIQCSQFTSLLDSCSSSDWDNNCRFEENSADMCRNLSRVMRNRKREPWSVSSLSLVVSAARWGVLSSLQIPPILLQHVTPCKNHMTHANIFNQVPPVERASCIFDPPTSGVTQFNSIVVEPSASYRVFFLTGTPLKS